MYPGPYPDMLVPRQYGAPEVRTPDGHLLCFKWVENFGRPLPGSATRKGCCATDRHKDMSGWSCREQYQGAPMADQVRDPGVA